MNFENCFPLWNDLNTAQKKIISDNLITQVFFHYNFSSYSLHGASFINGFARVASTKEKAIGAAVGAVGGLAF